MLSILTFTQGMLDIYFPSEDIVDFLTWKGNRNPELDRFATSPSRRIPVRRNRHTTRNI